MFELIDTRNAGGVTYVVGEPGPELVVPTTAGRVEPAPPLLRRTGYVDRGSVRADQPMCVVMCSEGMQADGIDLRMSGARLDRFRANPILGYGHMYFGRINLPIGRVLNPRIDGTRMLGDLDFDQADDFARTVERKMRDGYLSAVSIGFNVADWEEDERGKKGNRWDGGVAIDWELAELSVVPVPMDASAVVESGRSAEAVITELIRTGRPVLATGPPDDPPTPETPEPPAGAGGSLVPADTARSLLAALDLKGLAR